GPDADVVIFSEVKGGQSFVPRAVPGQEPPPAVMTALESIGSQQITPLADDSWALEAALVLFRQMQPRVLLINLPGTDEAGHLTGGSAAGMTPVIKNVDYQIGQLVAAYRSAGLLEQTIFIITSDHGMAEQPPELDTGLMETAFQAAGVKAVPPSRVAASSLWITPWQKANLLAAKIDALNIPQVTGVYYKTLDETTNSFLYQSTPATQQRLDPVLNAAYRYLLDTTAGPRGAEVALTRASPPLALPEHEDTKGQHHEVSWPTQHIPLIIYGPGVKQGFVSDYPARLVDLAPTVLALMGLQAEGMDGLILADALTASTPEQRAAQDALANTLWPLQDALISEVEAAGPQQ
ncbi:MAG: alkaline phosphatase family protein, partial [Anaerolineae bacterium]